MKLFKKAFVASSTLLLSLSACSASNALPISKKEFKYESFTEISVEEGLYGSVDGFIGQNKDELASKVKSGLVVPDTNKLVVGDTPISGLTYNGQAVKAYSVSDYKTSDGVSSFKCYTLPTANENEYVFLKNSGGSMELSAYTVELGYRTGSKTSGGSTVTYTYKADVSFDAVKYNKDAGTLSTKVTVKDVSTIDDETTTLTGTFTITFKA